MYPPSRICVLLVLVGVAAGQADAGLFDWLVRLTPRQYVDVNEWIYASLGEATWINRNVNVREKMDKRQPQISDEVEFPCDVTNGRSPERPISVHALRPGDIDVVGAMGDSLTAAFGALAVDILTVYVGNRGVSFSVGGQDTWRTAMTLPNILKEFNPNLVGYATGDALSWQRPSQFNLAEALAVSLDMPHQARVMVRRMRADPRVNFEMDWKVVTIMVGYNNICSFMCYENLEEFYQNHCKSLIEALDILHDHMPRVLVNLVPVANVNRVFHGFTEKPHACHAFNAIECACVLGLQFSERRDKHDALIEAWMKFDEDIMTLDRYKDKDDFTVVAQPFTTELTVPTRQSRVTESNVTDYTYLSPDCFHFSQKGHALAANALWNNMMEPDGNKARDWPPGIMSSFRCPSIEHPFIFTSLNTPSP